MTEGTNSFKNSFSDFKNINQGAKRSLVLLCNLTSRCSTFLLLEATMSGLVADYGSSSNSDESEEETEKSAEVETKARSLIFLEESEEETEKSAEVETNASPAPEERLPLPSFSTELLGASVFSNPYRQAEDARRAVLEKHVKLTTAPADLRQINGKQVCWNYRKGRCRFGRGCKFAHDSDLQRSGDEPAEPAEPSPAEPGRKRAAAAVAAADGEVPRKKRPGLSQTLVPGKKVLKMFSKTRKGPLV